jgi:hypothetical protein
MWIRQARARCPAPDIMPERAAGRGRFAVADQPLSLEALVDLGALDGFVAPTGSFDPEAGWELRYRLWLAKKGDAGTLKLTRPATAPGGAGVLTVEQSVTQSSGVVHETDVTIDFVADALSTPQSWEIDAVIVDASNPIERTRVSRSAVVVGGEIRETVGGSEFVRPAPTTFTSNWSLFDAAQRLSGASTSPLEFDLLEDLDLLKESQELVFRETRLFDVNGQTLSLTGYEMIGRGVLPLQLWLDDQRRPLFVFSGVCAYIVESVRNDPVERFRETWNSADLPQTFPPGASGAVAGADKTWACQVESNAGPVAIEEETPGGNRRLTAAGGGGSSSNFSYFTSNDVSVDFDSAGSVTIKATITLNETGADDSRIVWVALRDSAPDVTGCIVQFNGTTTRVALAVHVYVAGTKLSTWPGGKGLQQAGETYFLTVTFTPSGADMLVSYQVEKASGGDLIAPGVKTIAGAALPAGTTLDTVETTFRHLAACAVDDIVIET